jgi:hypothetical protein
MLGLPHKVKYINMENQKTERIWASRVSDRQLIEIMPNEQIQDVREEISE